MVPPLPLPLPLLAVSRWSFASLPPAPSLPVWGGGQPLLSDKYGPPPLRLPLINFENCFQDDPSVSSLRTCWGDHFCSPLSLTSTLKTVFKVVCLHVSSLALRTCWGDHFCLTSMVPPPSPSHQSALKTVSMQDGLSPCLLDPPSRLAGAHYCLTKYGPPFSLSLINLFMWSSHLVDGRKGGIKDG